MDEIDIDLQHIVFYGLDENELIANDVKKKQRIIDRRTDIVARMLALYPTTPNKKLSRMFNMSYKMIVKLANDAGVNKVISRGGHNSRKVEIMNLEGNIIAVYDSSSQAGRHLGFNGKSLQYILSQGRCKRLSNGTFARYR